MFGLGKKSYSKEMEETANVMIHNSKGFTMKVDNVFSIVGRGTVIVGTVSNGEVCVGDTIKFMFQDEEVLTTVNGIEMLRKQVEKVKTGDECGLLLEKDLNKKIKQGTVIYR